MVKSVESIKELSESIRKILQDRREARAVKLAKHRLRISIMHRSSFDRKKFSYTKELDLLAELDVATTKEGIKQFIRKLENM